MITRLRYGLATANLSRFAFNFFPAAKLEALAKSLDPMQYSDPVIVI